MARFKIIGVVLLILFIILMLAVWFWMKQIIIFDETKIPTDLITSQFIDLDRVYAISKFRSGAGHDFSRGAVKDETCRSMKHYFNNGSPGRSKSTPDQPNIKIYAPFDGKITSIKTEHTGVQVHILSNKYPYTARIFHIDLLPGFKSGSELKSGQWIGIIGPKDGTDFSIEGHTLSLGTVYLSYFQSMTVSVFEPFAKMGYQKEDFIISKEYRDAHPFRCGGTQTNPLNKSSETFQHEQNRSWQEDFIFLKEDPLPR